MQLVASRYLIIGATTYRHPSGRILRAAFHTGRARAYLLDTATAEALQNPAAVAALSEEDRSRLVSLDLLVPFGTDEAAHVIASGREAAAGGRERQFIIMPTAYCNMGCGYCGQTHDRSAGAPGTARHREAICARVTEAARSGSYDSVKVRWFGGEPLMGFAVLRALSLRFTAAADAHGVRYSSLIVTNGALLDGRKLIALHRDCRVQQIEITIDGPQAVHETSRPLKSGQGSFERIIAALRTVRDDPALAGLAVTVRTNVGAHNAGLANEFAVVMRDAGLAHPRITFYPAPVHAWGNDVTDYQLGLRQAAAAELAWYSAYVDAGLTCALLPSAPRRIVCSATARNSVVVAADGRVYSCTEQPLVPGHDDRHIATVDGLDAAAPRPAGSFDDWYETLERDETGCRRCPILPVCGGACPKLWREGRPPCPPIKTNLPERLDLYARAAGLTPV
jgi:uncharacterized protein